MGKKAQANAQAISPREDFGSWVKALHASSKFRQPEDETTFLTCCDAVTGHEDAGPCIEALVGAVSAREDHGLYEALHNALWRFPRADLGEHLALLLPAWLKRVRTMQHQIIRFLGPLFGYGSEALASFVKGLEALPDGERAAVQRAFQRWSLDIPDFATLAEALRKGPPRRVRPQAPLPAPPDSWPSEWKEALETLRRGESAISIWQSGTKAETDAVIALLTQPLGEGVRHLEVLTNPLYISYAKKHWAYFVKRVAALSPEEQALVLAQLKKGSGRAPRGRDRGSILKAALEGPEAHEAERSEPTEVKATTVAPAATGRVPASANEFVPQVGFGPYRFGMSREACAKVVGPPVSVSSHPAMPDVTEYRGPIAAVFIDDALVEVQLLKGAVLEFEGRDLLKDVAAVMALAERYPPALKQGPYLNLSAISLLVLAGGKRKQLLASLYTDVVAGRVRFLGLV